MLLFTIDVINKNNATDVNEIYSCVYILNFCLFTEIITFIYTQFKNRYMTFLFNKIKNEREKKKEKVR